MKKYRFFYHYHKQKKKMSIHFKGTCILIDNIECLVPSETKWNKTQPILVMRGFAREVRIEGKSAIIM